MKLSTFLATAITFIVATMVSVGVLAVAASDLWLLYMKAPGAAFSGWVCLSFLVHLALHPRWPGSLAREDITVVQFLVVVFTPTLLTLTIWGLGRLTYQSGLAGL